MADRTPDAPMVESPGHDPPRWSRRWFGRVLVPCWAGLVVLNLLDWHPGGVVYWLVAGPLGVGFVASGIAWCALWIRDLHRQRRQVAEELGPLVAPLLVAAALVAGLVMIGTLIGL